MMKPLLKMAPLRVLFSILLLCSVGAAGCRNQAILAGAYEAAGPADAARAVLLELRPDGSGWWTVDDEQLPFRWEQRDGEILLHTKSGGIIAGKVADGAAIHILLPGVGPLSFKRASHRAE